MSDLEATKQELARLDVRIESVMRRMENDSEIGRLSYDADASDVDYEHFIGELHGALLDLCSAKREALLARITELSADGKAPAKEGSAEEQSDGANSTIPREET